VPARVLLLATRDTIAYSRRPGHEAVVVASRCRTRDVPPDELHVGAALAAKVGAIGARRLTPTKARTALMVALGGGGVDAVRDWFGRL
jgi:L-asparaginase